MQRMRLTEKDGAVRFEVAVRPKAKKSQVIGEKGDAVEVAVAAPPVDGAANEELIRFLAKVLDVPKRDISLLRGETSRTKLIAVTSIRPDELRARFAAPRR